MNEAFAIELLMALRRLAKDPSSPQRIRVGEIRGSQLRRARNFAYYHGERILGHRPKWKRFYGAVHLSA